MPKKRIFDLHSFYDSNNDIEQHVVRILAVASAIANTIGFLANVFLYGINVPTAVCGICAILCWVHMLYGSGSARYMFFGSMHLVILCVFEFPLLVFAYGPVMYPYMILGYMGVLMLTKDKVRTRLCALLIIFDVAVIALSSIFPYVFGPQDSVGLMGSAIITFLVTIISFSVCIIIWQNVYIRRTSDIDPATGVLSQEGFIREVTKTISNEPSGKYAVLFFNIVSFKAVNAMYGIEGGNHILKQIAKRLKASSMLKPYFVCRHVADHFYVLVEEQNIDYSGIGKLCQYEYRGKSMNLSLQLNCGIYVIDDTSMGVSAICDRAKSITTYSAMMRSQHFAVYDAQMEETFNKENEVLAMVEEAANNQEFEPYYQPIVDCNTGKIVHAEALARWIRPDGTLVSPGVFIPILEKKEMISILDDTIITKVNNFIVTRHNEGKTVYPVSLNLSRIDLYNEQFMTKLRIMVKKSNMDKSFYHFEITESSYENIPDSILDTISKLRELGAQIYIDDFGAGYSSLGMISEFKFDVLKLDMSFARKIAASREARNVIKSLINLAHDINVKVVAEGIETEEQVVFLKYCGCDYIQGYYYYRPMPESEYCK